MTPRTTKLNILLVYVLKSHMNIPRSFIHEPKLLHMNITRSFILDISEYSVYSLLHYLLIECGHKRVHFISTLSSFLIHRT